MSELILTIEIDGVRYGMKYDQAQYISSGDLGEVVESTLDAHFNRVTPLKMPVRLEDK